MEMLDVKARDGQALRAYLTVPLVGGPRPLVVMPHGGPEDRDTYRFELFAQTFAAQGWLVLQPNFRGSGGYGRAFAEAGHRHCMMQRRMTPPEVMEQRERGVGRVISTTNWTDGCIYAEESRGSANPDPARFRRPPPPVLAVITSWWLMG